MNSLKLTVLFSSVLMTRTSFSVMHTMRLFSVFLLKLFSVHWSKSSWLIRYSMISSLCACSWSSCISVSPVSVWLFGVLCSIL